MSDLPVPVEVIVVFIIAVVGVGLTVVYYFFRYFYKTHEGDQELALGSTEIIEKREDGKSSQEPLPASKKTSQEAVSFKKKDLKEALKATREGLWGRIQNVFSGIEVPDEESWENLEEVLYTSDLGPQTVQQLMTSVGEKLESSSKKNIDKIRQALREEMEEIFLQVQEKKSVLEVNEHSPYVIMVVGVNGAGKTTTIGKLAHYFSQKGQKVLLAAGDTFRAAAGEQLNTWSNRAGVEIFNPGNTKDPSGVAFDACQKAKAQGYDVLIVDTAGRLHTQDNLMEELKKMKRVLKKVIEDAPHECLIVLDSNSGQNALIQAKMFNESLGLTGAILTKLDGTAKGGVALGLAYELHLPIRLIGVGEQINDLRSFEAHEFVESIL